MIHNPTLLHQGLIAEVVLPFEPVSVLFEPQAWLAKRRFKRLLSSVY
jgi:hypothetical protein